jgi:hypothetical protein
VADNRSFGNPIADVLTNSTAYTSTNTFAADAVLYWRVRANDENRLGLTWSAAREFRRRLPVPVQSAANPLGGETIPVLSWAPVAGAVSYGTHFEQADGTKRDFTTRATAFAPVTFYGTGVWHWRVRANFKSGSGIVSGGYSSVLPYTRRIATPTGLKSSRRRGRIVMAWQPAGMARRYRVQISTSDGFSKILEQTLTDNTSYAPKMSSPLFRKSKRLYWRVAVVDEGSNSGGFATSRLRRR